MLHRNVQGKNVHLLEITLLIGAFGHAAKGLYANANITVCVFDDLPIYTCDYNS